MNRNKQLSFTIPSSVSLSTLESHLWEAANILRGSPVDRTDWKSYILPLLFFKRICDVWAEEYKEAVETYGEDFADEHRFQVPEGCHWNDVREKPSNVGTALQNAMRGIEAANQKHLYGVFGDTQWTNKDRLPDALLKDLLEHFSALNLGNTHVTTDIINLVKDPRQFEERLRQAQAKEAATMQPKQKELEHVIALLKDAEEEADEIARAATKVKGIVGQRL